MKSWLAMAGTGVGLFSATVVITLAAQGRLDGDSLGSRGNERPQDPLQKMQDAEDPQEPASTSTVDVQDQSDGSESFPELEQAPTLEISEESLNRFAASLRERERRLDGLQVMLDERAQKLARAGISLDDREADIQAAMLKVDAERAKVDEALTELRDEVILIRKSDRLGLRIYVESLAGADPSVAANVIMESQNDPVERVRVLKALSMMRQSERGPIMRALPREEFGTFLAEFMKIRTEAR